MRTLAPPLLLAALTGMMLLFFPASSSAQPLNEFIEIHAPDPGLYDMYQLKFTYLGPQKKTVLSLGISGPAVTFDPVMFQPWQVGYDYSNDEIMGHLLIIPGLEWQMFMDFILADPILQSTDRIADPNCSLMIRTDALGPPLCWEHLATRVETDLLFQALEDSVVDPVHKEIIARYRRQMAGVRR